MKWHVSVSLQGVLGWDQNIIKVPTFVFNGKFPFLKKGERGSLHVPVLLRKSLRRNKASHYRPTSEMPFKWRFAGGSMMARNWMLAVAKMVESPIRAWSRASEITGSIQPMARCCVFARYLIMVFSTVHASLLHGSHFIRFILHTSHLIV